MRRIATWIMVALALGGCPGGRGPSEQAVDAWLAGAGAGEGPGGETVGPPRAAVATRLAITVEGAKGLPDTDSGPGVTDPYVIIEYEGDRYETSVVEGSQEPSWGDSFIFDVRAGGGPAGGVLTVSLMDEDALGADEKLGVIARPLEPIRVGETRTLELSFRHGEGGVLSLTITGLEGR